MTITRHPGTWVQVGGASALVGGGYSGATPELDAVVQQAAEMLSQAFKRDVVIRFNSDRLSGGAFLKDYGPGPNADAQVGLTAGLYPVRPEGMTEEDYFHLPLEALNEAWRTWPKAIRISSLIAWEALKHKSQANTPSGGDRKPRAYHCHNSLEDGLAYLLKYAYQEPPPPPPQPVRRGQPTRPAPKAEGTRRLF